METYITYIANHVHLHIEVKGIRKVGSLSHW